MNWLIWLAVLLPCTFLHCDQIEDDSVYENIATLEGTPSAVIGNAVNAITGVYCDCQTDLIVQGAHPIQIQRFYSSSNLANRSTSFSGVLSNAAPWEWNHGGLVYISPAPGHSSKYQAHVYKGSSLNGLVYRSEDHDNHRLKIHKNCFHNGMTNSNHQLISGQTNHKNTRLQLSKGKNCLIRTGSGIKTEADCLFSYDSTKYRIEKETNPNGNFIKYDYKYANHLDLKTIRGCNADGQSLASVSIEYPKEIHHGAEKDWEGKPVIYQAPDGRKVSYYFDQGRSIKRRLRRVVRSDKPEEKYYYESAREEAHGVGGLVERVIRKELPQNRFVEIEYSHHASDNKRGRVNKLKAPIGTDETPHTQYSFEYHKDHEFIGCGTTDVWDAHHNRKNYAHDYEKRLIAISSYDGSKIYRTERFYWGIDNYPKSGDHLLFGNLITRLIQEGKDGPVLSCRNFVYDDHGNILEDRLYGNLTGKKQSSISLSWFGAPINSLGEPGEIAIPKKNSSEHSKKVCTYTGSSYNLLASENNGRSIVKYSYEPHSNRLSAKFICDLDGKIKKRCFYKYDKNSMLIREIIDDGDTMDQDDFTAVTERKITYTRNRKTLPIGLPELIEEKCLDLATGEELLIKKTVNRHSPDGRLESQDHFDDRGIYVYSLFWKYDSMGNLIQETDAMGRTTTREYDLCGNKIMEQKPGVAYCEQYEYDYCNRLITIKERYSKNKKATVSSYEYNKLSQREAEIDRFDNKTEYHYDHFGRCDKISYPLLRTLDDQSWQPIKKSNFNALDQPIRQYDCNENLTKTKFTVRGGPYEIAYPDGSKEEFEYTIDGLLKKHRTIDGILTVYDHDYQGRPTQISCFSAQGDLLYSTTTIYNAFHKISETDAAGHLTVYTYDPAGRIKEVVKGSQKTAYLYDSLGRISKTLEYTNEADYLAEVKLYDFLDRIIEERLEDSQGNLQSKIEYTYNLAGDKECEIRYLAEGIASTSTIQYDSYHRPIKLIDAEGHATHISYREDYPNGLGQNVLYKETTDPLGRITVEIYNALGHLEEEIHKNSFGEITGKKFFYRDANGLLLKQIETVMLGIEPVREVVTRWKYDAMNRLIDCYEALGTPKEKHTAIRYNTQGQKSAIIKPDDLTIHHDYDAFGRLKEFYASDKSFHYTYQYDLNSNLIAVNDLNNRTINSRIYDDNDRMIDETLGNGLNIHYDYDRAGRVTKTGLPDETAVSYEYDGYRLSRVARLTKNGKTGYRHSYEEFDLSGNVLQSKLIGRAGPLTQRYDLLQRNIETTHHHYSEKGFLYDKVGNLLEKNIDDSHGSKPHCYTYDALDQLVTEKGFTQHTYASDSLYNRMEKDGKAHKVNRLNQLLSDGEKTLTYDLSGNLEKIVQSSGEVHFTYDALNRLTQRTEGDQCHRYTYDSFNRRLSKLELLLKSGVWHPVHRTHYLYQEQNEIGASENGTITQLRLLGLGKGAEIGATIAIELDGKPYAPIHDQNGNIVKLLDAETGTIAATYRYTAFGEETSIAQVKNPWRYASKRVDDESGFIYFGRRYYAPQFGRWITPDPIGFEDGPNLYAYVHNRPLTHFDAYGLEDAGDGGGFFGFSWGGMCDGLCTACSVVANTTCEFGVGMFNGYTSPIDTAGGWINGQNGDGGSPSIAKRFGEVCGVVALGVSFYYGGVAIVSSEMMAGQFCVQGTRMAAREALSYVGTRVIADAVADSAGPVAAECAAPVRAAERLVVESISEGTKNGADFIVGPNGIVIPTSRRILEQGFQEAGFATFPTDSKGLGYILPNGSKVRIMEPSGQAPLRASFTNSNDGAINIFTNKPPQPPKGLDRTGRLDFVRKHSHLELNP